MTTEILLIVAVGRADQNNANQRGPLHNHSFGLEDLPWIRVEPSDATLRKISKGILEAYAVMSDAERREIG
jgi:hypothetical protein